MQLINYGALHLPQDVNKSMMRVPNLMKGNIHSSDVTHQSMVPPTFTGIKQKHDENT